MGMTTEDRLRWTRIEEFQIDDPAVAFSFTARLARENGWTDTYAKRVVKEYKKFIFLCCLTDTGVTPSDAVDQAWHLHLTFTRSYWVDFCRDTIGREIHHNPTKGGKQEAQKFDGFYTSTHQLYRETFGTEPPADIWPGNQTRFQDIDFQRVNRRINWIVRKPAFPLYGVATLLGLLLVAALFVQASSTGVIISLMTVLFGVVFILIVSLAHYVNGDGDQNRRKTAIRAEISASFRVVTAEMVITTDTARVGATAAVRVARAAVVAGAVVVATNAV